MSHLCLGVNSHDPRIVFFVKDSFVLTQTKILLGPVGLLCENGDPESLARLA